MKASTSPATSTATSVSRVYVCSNKLFFSRMLVVSDVCYHCCSSFNDHEKTVHALPSEASALHTEVMVSAA